MTDHAIEVAKRNAEYENSESIGYLQVKKGFFWESPNRLDLQEYINKKHNLAICVRAICMNDLDSWDVNE